MIKGYVFQAFRADSVAKSEADLGGEFLIES